VQVVVDGVTRSYTLHVPSTYDGNNAVPLVLDFHPMRLGLTWERENSGFLELSEQEGFILLWPLGLEDSWNIGPCCTSSKTIDDFSFIRAVVRQLSNDACVDPKRVYAVGFSMGAAMAQYLACEQAEVFAAVASSGMDLLVDAERSCSPSRPISTMSFRGTDDTTVPYAGGKVSLLGVPDMTMEVLGAVGTFGKWASLDGCTGAPSEVDVNGCSTYSNCKDGSEVTLCTLVDQGQVVGDARLSWDFLKKHPMP
jgi:polyhydroxybutyrate depolymerase